MGNIPTLSIQAGEEGQSWWDTGANHYTGKKYLTAQEALTKSGLDELRYEMRDMVDVNGLAVDNQRHIVRLEHPILGPDMSMGVSGMIFEPVQPSEIADYMGAMLGYLHDEGYYITSAFELEAGRRLCFVAKTNDLLVAGNDSISRYLQGSTANDGTGSTRFDETDVRGVCENTLLAAIRGTKRTQRFKHSTRNNDRMRDAAKLARETRLYNGAFAEYAARMLETKIEMDAIDELIATLIPGKVNEKGELSTRAKNMREDLLSNIVTTNTVENDWRYSAYGVWNSATEWEQHDRGSRETGRDPRALLWNRRVTGTSANFSEKAFELLTTSIDNDDVMKKITTKNKEKRTLKVA